MKKKRGIFKNLLNLIVMETNELFVKELSVTELRDVTGGSFPMLIIKALIPTYERIKGFIDGFRQGYERATEE
jgi:hypothetical protein